jgi:hypothetical protein
MKDPGNAAKKLLDLPYAPEAEAFLDELERSGQFRVGLEAELDDDGSPDQGLDYSFGRGSGNVFIQDWWTCGHITLRIAPGLLPEHLHVSRLNDSLVLRTDDSLDSVTLEGYLGLIPDASTLRVLFADGTEWLGTALLKRVVSWLAEVPAGN